MVDPFRAMDFNFYASLAMPGAARFKHGSVQGSGFHVNLKEYMYDHILK